MTPLIIVDQHHHVLRSWAELRDQLQEAPTLLTLDHHTDTSQPFRKFLNSKSKTFSQEQSLLLDKIDFKSPKTIEVAISKLAHDEHVLTAIRANIISKALVIAHNAFDTDKEVFNLHKVVCTEVNDHNRVLESDFLKSCVEKINSILNESDNFSFNSSYILDIDLDYFNTFKSIEPQDSDFFCELVENASLVTIATESKHVEMCALDSHLTSDYLLKKLLKLSKCK